MTKKSIPEEKDFSLLYRWIILSFLICILAGVVFVFIVFPLFTGHAFAPVESPETSSETVVSSCQVLIRAGTYVLNGSLVSEGMTSCIKVLHPDVTLDCRGHTLQFNLSLIKEGVQQYLFFSEYPRTTLRNCAFFIENGSGVYFGSNAVNSEILESSFFQGTVGVYLNHTANVRIASTTFSSNHLGIESLGTSGFVLESSNFSFNDVGVHLLQNERWLLQKNVFANNTRGAYLTQSSAPGLNSGVRNTTFSGNSEVGLFLGSAFNTTLRDNLFQDNLQGLILSNSSSLILYHNSFVRQRQNATLFLEGSLNSHTMHKIFKDNGQETEYLDELSLNNFFFVFGSPQISAFASEEGVALFSASSSTPVSLTSPPEVSSDSLLPFWGMISLGIVLVLVIVFAFLGMFRRPSWSLPRKQELPLPPPRRIPV